MSAHLRRILLLCGTLGALLLAVSVSWGAPPSVKDLIGALKSSDEAAQVKAIDQLGAKGAKAADAVAPLTELLKASSAKVRAHAAVSLGEIGAAAKPSVPAIAELLKDADDSVRRQAVKAVIRIRPGPEVTVPLCVKLLEDSDPGVRLRILHAIAQAKAEAMPGLVAALKNDKAAYWACIVLREIGPAGKEAVPALTERLSDPRPEIRREAALALGAMEKAGAAAAPQLARLLGDEHARNAATVALGQIGQIPSDAETQIRANAKGSDRLLSTVSLWALARVHPEDKQIRREAGERLVAALKDPDTYVRVAAARALAALPPAPEVMLPIWEKTLQDADATTVHHALDALAALGPAAVPRLVDALKHEKIRPQLISILGRMGPDAAPAAQALAGLLGDRSERVASEAAMALGRIGPAAKAAVPALTQSLEQRESPVADAAAFALGKIGPGAAAAEPALRKAVNSPQASLAVVSAWALVRVCPKSAQAAAIVVPVLVKGLGSPVAKFRQGAAEALGELGPLGKDAAAPLEKALGDKNKSVRDAAEKALKSIRG